MTRLPALAALAALALVSPALAGAANTAEVRYGDLDLTTVEGRTKLDRRIHYAARKICDVSGERELAAQMAARKCYRVALASTQSQVAAVIARKKRAA